MGNRLDLHKTLIDIMGSKNVYFQPPETIKMRYPAIVYSLATIKKLPADDLSYLKYRAYTLILIDPDPDSEFVDKILELPMCTFDRAYAADNLSHWAFTLFY